MEKKYRDLFDILEPTQIVIKEYVDKTIPFLDSGWIDNSDLTIQEIARLLPHQLSFVYAVLNEYPDLLPIENHFPGRIQQLIYQDIMGRLKNKTVRDYNLERKISKLWADNGGHESVSSTGKGKNNE